MLCDTCGREIPDGSRFCTFCGATVAPTLPEEPILSTEEPALPSEPASLAEPDVQLTAPDVASLKTEAAPVEQKPFDAPQPAPGFGAAPDTSALPYGAPQPAPQQAQPYGAPQPAPAYGAPQPAPQQAQPYGAPQPAPQQQPYGAPQPAPAYGAAPEAPVQDPAQAQPKKSKAWIIILVVVLVLLCCIGTSIGGYFLYKNITENVPIVNYDPPVPTPTPTPEPNPTPNPTPDPTPTPNPSPNNVQSRSDGVLVDNSDLTVTIKPGSGKYDSLMEEYVFEVTVDNKTDKAIYLTFDYDTIAEEYSGEDLITLFYAGDYNIDFPAKAKTNGTLIFLDVAKEDKIVSIIGTLEVYDTETFKSLGEYEFNVTKL